LGCRVKNMPDPRQMLHLLLLLLLLLLYYY